MLVPPHPQSTLQSTLPYLDGSHKSVSFNLGKVGYHSAWEEYYLATGGVRDVIEMYSGVSQDAIRVSFLIPNGGHEQEG
jgi:hypothetical protein